MQFVDVETMKPMPGVLLSSVWQTITPPGKRGSDVAAVAALRSGKDGWIRFALPESRPLQRSIYWSVFAPGYEHFAFEQNPNNPAQIIHVIHSYTPDLAKYPAWTKRLIALGYVHRQSKWSKAFPRAGFVDDGKHYYLIRYRSSPGTGNYALGSMQFTNTNVPAYGLSESERNFARKQNLVEQLNIVCDEKWDSAVNAHYPASLYTIMELIPNSTFDERVKILEEKFPDYSNQANRMVGINPAFTQTQRLSFCSWMKPYAENIQ